jgi:hypothetical protein
MELVMRKSFREALHPEAINKFEEYLEILIAEAILTWDFEPVLIDGEWVNECIHQFSFPDTTMNNIENLLRPVKFLDREDIRSICDGILDQMFWKYGVIKEKFSDEQWEVYSDENGPQRVKDCVDEKFLLSAKEAMCKYFCSLPIEYIVLFPLPYVKLPTSESIKISDTIELFKIERKLNIGDSPPCWSKLLEDGLLEPPERECDDKIFVIVQSYKTYVLIKVQGASLNTSINEMFQDAMRQFKVLIAALYVSGIIQESEGIERDWYPYGVLDSSLLTPVSEPLKLLRYQEESDWIKLPPAEWDFMRALILNDSLMEPTPFEKEVNSSDAKLKRLEQLLMPIRKAFVTDGPVEQMKEVERVRNALEWFLNGLIEKRNSFSFIQLTIAAESLLGDPKSHYDITDRLSDRCAYLIGENALERREIKKNFRDAYDIRSRILHEGKVSFDKNDKVHYSNMKWFLQKALAKEINVLSNV